MTDNNQDLHQRHEELIQRHDELTASNANLQDSIDALVRAVVAQTAMSERLANEMELLTSVLWSTPRK